MEKVVWFLRGDGRATFDVVDALRDLVLEPAVLGLTVNQHDDAAAEAQSPAPAPEGEDTHVVEVSAWFRNYQERGVVDEALALLGLLVDSYLVVESLVDDYGTTPHAEARTWPDGERSPGVLTVAVIHRPESLSEASWVHNWHEVQSPVSGQLQPCTRYVRNQVVRALSPQAPDIGGIVEEGWPSARHVTDPMLFFNAGGDPEVLNANLETMMGNVIACLDLDRLRSTTMSEHLLKSLAIGGMIQHVVTSGTFSIDGEDFAVDNNIWLVGDDDEVLVIDAAHDHEPILEAVGDRQVVAIVATHGHNDHINAGAALAEATGAPILLHPADAELWSHVYGDRPWSADLADGEVLEAGGHRLEVRHTPGHTPGGVCLYDAGAGVVFSADTLFRGGPGATGRSFSDFPTIIESIKAKLLVLPPDTVVHTGHGDSTTIGDEAPHLDEWIARGH